MYIDYCYIENMKSKRLLSVVTCFVTHYTHKYTITYKQVMQEKETLNYPRVI